jgi:hypothetical protein
VLAVLPNAADQSLTHLGLCSRNLYAVIMLAPRADIAMVWVGRTIFVVVSDTTIVILDLPLFTSRKVNLGNEPPLVAVSILLVNT